MIKELIKIKNKTLDYFKPESKSQKLEVILEYLIDSIEVKGNIVHIKTSKDLVLENNGNTVFFTKGYNIQVAEKIHLNPDFNFNIDSREEISNIRNTADESERKAHFKFFEKLPDMVT